MTTEIDVASYRENGYLLVRGLVSKQEAADLRAAVHGVLDRANAPADAAWLSSRKVITDHTKPELQSLHDVQFYDTAFARMLLDDRFTSVAAAVLGVENVQLHHTKAFVKPPENGAPFPMHQDYPFFPHQFHRVGAAIFFFDDAPEEKGCVRVVPGSHKAGPAEHDPDGNYHLPVAEWPLEDAVAVEAEAGDVLFFSYLLVHGSGINRSDEVRTTWLVQFRDPDDYPTMDRHTESRGQGMMLRGIDPGVRQAVFAPRAGAPG